jgi:solute carrier family 6 amino acid transporter-like protein 5/7/9/14
MIVTTLDTFTSLLAGSTIFSILGNLIYEMGEDDIRTVVAGGPGLAFVSYPDAIAKFDAVPQVSDISCIRKVEVLFIYLFLVYTTTPLVLSILTIECQKN